MPRSLEIVSNRTLIRELMLRSDASVIISVKPASPDDYKDGKGQPFVTVAISGDPHDKLAILQALTLLNRATGGLNMRLLDQL